MRRCLPLIATFIFGVLLYPLLLLPLKQGVTELVAFEPSCWHLSVDDVDVVQGRLSWFDEGEFDISGRGADPCYEGVTTDAWVQFGAGQPTDPIIEQLTALDFKRSDEPECWWIGRDGLVISAYLLETTTGQPRLWLSGNKDTDPCADLIEGE